MEFFFSFCPEIGHGFSGFQIMSRTFMFTEYF
jgi:hypothetical protein